MKAKFDILYSEYVDDLNYVDGISIEISKNKVFVELVFWYSKKYQRKEYVLREVVVIDEARSYIATDYDNPTERRSYYIREAIQRFDSLVKSHPILGKDK